MATSSYHDTIDSTYDIPDQMKVIAGIDTFALRNPSHTIDGPYVDGVSVTYEITFTTSPVAE